MISFYPGPSRIYSRIPEYVNDAYSRGILEVNHRSRPFMDMVVRLKELMRKRLGVPRDYWVFFPSSATECWEIIGQSLVKDKSLHIYNGAFGQKWQKYTAALEKTAKAYPFGMQEELIPLNLPVEQNLEMVAVTQNETANGTQVNNGILKKIRNLFPKRLIAVDATSSMGGVNLELEHADIWFASVQKCFGLPAGMAVLICSPKTVEVGEAIGENQHYNSFSFMVKNARINQPTHTPNILAIYLLSRILETEQPVQEIEKKIKERRLYWEKIIAQLPGFELLIKNPEVRSDTVIAVEGSPDKINQIKDAAYQEGFLLGNGYGELKENTFRIANFPAIRPEEILQLSDFFENYGPSFYQRK